MVKIVVDSGSDLQRGIIEKDGCLFDCVPLNLQLEDRVYVDDENLNLDEFIERMELSPAGVKSASPSPALFMDKFHDGDSVFVVTLSSKLSGTYNSALTAKRMYLDECGKKFIHVFDSLSASIGEGLVAMKIAEFAKNGLNNVEIVNNVNDFIKNMRTYFLLDKFDSLVKTGRINPYIAKVASLLNIKAICGDNTAGEIRMVDKARGHNKAVKRLVQIIKESTPDLENRIVGISYVKCYERAVAFKEELLSVMKVKDVVIMEARGLVATYANRGGFVVAV